MPGSKLSRLISFVSLLSLVTHPSLALSQGQTQDDVIKVVTELVQTDVMVLDKEGRLVNGLKREDFEIKIDGKVREIQSVDRVVAGTGREQTLWTHATAAPAPASAVKDEEVSERKQMVLFYVDDLHLDASSMSATRKAIENFIDTQMLYNTEAGVTSPSGQIGFLQQLTDNPIVLRAALKRVQKTPYSVNDNQRPPMKEYDALLIDRGDSDVTGYFVEQTMAVTPGITPDTARDIVTGRAQAILGQAAIITKRTLAGLEQLVGTASKAPGRKILFLMSNGFFLDHKNSDAAERTQTIISHAARNGVVIYAIDARGLVASLDDASTAPAAIDMSQRLERATHNAIGAALDLMNLLAKDTGGKLVSNTNDLKAGLQRSLDESSTYYLLAWKPETGANDPSKFRKISVSVVGHPEFSVRVRRGFFAGNPSPAVASNESKGPETTTADPNAAALQKALVDPFAKQGLPLSIALNYLNTVDKGSTLSTSLQFSRSAVSFAPDASGKLSGAISILGAVYDDKGRAGAKLNDRLTLQTENAGSDAESSGAIVSTYNLKIPPGLYQVRVAARDQSSGRIGTANAWIEIPDFASPKLALSSLIVGGGKQAKLLTPTSQRNAVDSVGLNVDHRYDQNSTLRLLVFAYNAKVAESGRPEVAIQVEVLHNSQAVVSSPPRKISTEGVEDLKRLPYAADIPLTGLGRGHYQLKVTATDQLGKSTAMQEWRFEIE